MQTGFSKPTVEGMNKGIRAAMAYRRRSPFQIAASTQVCEDNPVYGSRGRRAEKSRQQANDMANDVRDWRSNKNEYVM